MNNAEDTFGTHYPNCNEYCKDDSHYLEGEKRTGVPPRENIRESERSRAAAERRAGRSLTVEPKRTEATNGDLLDRLRHSPRAFELTIEAADEIERLRAKIAVFRNCCGNELEVCERCNEEFEK